MQEVGSLHFELDATVTVPAGGVETEVPVSLVADYQPPDRMRAKLVVSVAFFALEMETIAIGDTIYATNLETGEWEVSSIDLTSALLRPTEFEGDVVIAENYDVVLVGLETLDGTPVFHLRGLPPQQIFGELDATAQANLWVGVEDLLIRQIAAEGEIALEELGEVFGQFGLSGTANISSTVRISGFGEPVLIEAPQIP